MRLACSRASIAVRNRPGRNCSSWREEAGGPPSNLLSLARRFLRNFHGRASCGCSAMRAATSRSLSENHMGSETNLSACARTISSSREPNARTKKRTHSAFSCHDVSGRSSSSPSAWPQNASKRSLSERRECHPSTPSANLALSITSIDMVCSQLGCCEV
eukprot:scaffold123404_cov23-Tisochrysis_lutea.AAC.4